MPSAPAAPAAPRASFFFAERPVTFPRSLAQPVGQVAWTACALGVLGGLCVPRALALLGLLPSLSWLGAPPLHAYLVFWALFHMLEFVVTAYWNETHLQSDSFLLQNGAEYVAAHTLGLLEFALESYVAPAWKRYTSLHVLGLLLIVYGQVLRSLAMVHASTNFTHALAHTKSHDHVLVTTGVYAFARHPSYAGFFWWAIGTQVLLGNPVSLLVFVVALVRFFAHRIQVEEAALCDFFGDAYRAYRARVAAGVPFVIT
ncbi:protein-S-isoprenylcysteine O-methyltransferase [Malassezia equina]|uniref:Protein-S-isoprenylcysteine O-methyltransferase n=1 Tax=Malassezia equina TaxID=1381935 RepID=A0AAF0EHV7_9BASI|nr:protein-S-isoprenylcysteine O-methyltransferase [Malassezia equina]